MGPEVEPLEGVVEPAGCDAEVAVVWRNVVDAMVSARQQNVSVLQPHDGCRQPKVRVRPLVNLVSETDEDDEQVDVHLPAVRLANLCWRVRQELVGHASKRNQTDGKVVTVCLDEVMTSDRCWVNVMLTEWPDQSLANHEQVDRAVGVSQPVHQPTEEVGSQHSKKSCCKNVVDIGRLEVFDEKEEVEDDEYNTQ